MKLICVNAGYYNTKVKTIEKETIFESKVQLNDDTTRHIIEDGEKYEGGWGKFIVKMPKPLC